MTYIAHTNKLMCLLAVTAFLGGIYMEQISGGLNLNRSRDGHTPLIQCFCIRVTIIWCILPAMWTMEMVLLVSLHATRSSQQLSLRARTHP